MDRLPDRFFQSYHFQDIVRDVKDYCICNGIGLRSDSEDTLQSAPVTLFPSPFPEKSFRLAQSVQTAMNLLMHNVSHNIEFMIQSLQNTIQVDEFTKNMLDVLLESERIGRAQDMEFGLFRTDYMFNESDNSLRQVESNAISSGFAILGPRTSRLHRYICKKYRPELLPALPDNNPADEHFPSHFIDAFRSYGNPSAVILYVIEDRTVNICDQRGHEFAISNKSDIRIVRRSFTELHDIIRVTEDRRLLIDHDLEVGLVYYRYCYDPSQYPEGEKSWQLRLKIEISKAIKCPSIGYHLSGIKKFQQILTDKDVLHKFLPDEQASLLHSTFTGLWGLECNEEGDRAAEMALKNPEAYVMKPQREGGGHNVYGNDIPAVLNPILNSKEREQFILMQMIRPPVVKNYILTPGQQTEKEQVSDIVSELGIFGAILGSKDGVVFNCECGHVLRSKKLGVNEGGVSAGFGALDSPLLY